MIRPRMISYVDALNVTSIHFSKLQKNKFFCLAGMTAGNKPFFGLTGISLSKWLSLGTRNEQWPLRAVVNIERIV